MAEIRVEKRKPIWPWILGGLAALALVIFLVAGNDNDNMNRDNRSESVAADGAEPEYQQEAPAGYRTEEQYGDENNKSEGRASGNRQGTASNIGNSDNRDNREVAEFVEFVRTDLREEELDHRKVSKAFSELNDATKAIAKNSGYPEENLEDTKEYIDMIDKDNFEKQNADQIRRTADVFADHLQKMQKANFPQLNTEAMQLVESSKRIKDNQPAIQQSEEIRSFLSEAAELVEKMD